MTELFGEGCDCIGGIKGREHEFGCPAHPTTAEPAPSGVREHHMKILRAWGTATPMWAADYIEALEANGAVSDVKWHFRQVGYEQFGIYDGRGTEVGFVHRRRDAERIATLHPKAVSAAGESEAVVEAVARALARHDNPKHENWWPSYERRARVAITALREQSAQSGPASSPME